MEDTSTIEKLRQTLESEEASEALTVMPAETYIKLAGYAQKLRATTGSNTNDAPGRLAKKQLWLMEGMTRRLLHLRLAKAAKEAVGDPSMLNVVADAGYSNGEQAEACEAQGLVPHVPANRAVNNQGNGQLFDRSQFQYDEKTDTFRCPAQQTLTRKQLSRKDRAVYYAAQPEACRACALKARCTNGAQRLVSRHLHEGALQRMQHRATPEVMRLRRSTVEHPFASLKYHIFGNPRFLLRGLQGAQAEISLATTVYNLKRMLNVLGANRLRTALAG